MTYNDLIKYIELCLYDYKVDNSDVIAEYIANDLKARGLFLKKETDE